MWTFKKWNLFENNYLEQYLHNLGKSGQNWLSEGGPDLTTFTYHRNSSTTSVESAIVTCSSTLKVLGSLITLSEIERAEYFIKKACNALNIMILGIQLRKQSYLLVTRMCIASKLMHLLRTLPIPSKILSDFDEVVLQIITSNLSLPNSAMKELIFYPQQKGGLGITALSEVQLIASLPLQTEMFKLSHINRIARFYYESIRERGDSNTITRQENGEQSSSSSSSLSVSNSFSSSSSNSTVINNHVTATSNNESSLVRARHSSSSSSSVAAIESEMTLFNYFGIPCVTHDKAGFLTLMNIYEPITSLEKLLASTKNEKPFIQHELWMAQNEKKYKALLELKKNTNTTQYLTLLAMSKDTSSASWLRTIPFSNFQKMTDEEFLHSVHYRLGVADDIEEMVKQQDPTVFRHKKWKESRPSSSSSSSVTATANRYLLCPLCGMRMGKFHYANCQVTGPIRTSRHNLIKRLIASVFTQLPATTVMVEDYFAGKGYKEEDDIEDEADDSDTPRLTNMPRSTNMVPDITVMITDNKREHTQLERTILGRQRDAPGLIKFSLDLTVVDIHSTSNRKAHLQGRFAEAAEERKKQHYEHYNQTHNVKCIPFGMSSVGELGPTARAILDFLSVIGRRHSVFINVNGLIEQIDLLLESSRYQMEKVYKEELVRRINIAAGYKHRMDTAATLLSPSLLEEQRGRKRAKVGTFWERQLVTMQNFIRTKTSQNLSQQRAEELYHRLFSWIPEREGDPTDRGPPDKHHPQDPPGQQNNDTDYGDSDGNGQQSKKAGSLSITLGTQLPSISFPFHSTMSLVAPQPTLSLSSSSMKLSSKSPESSSMTSSESAPRTRRSTSRGKHHDKSSPGSPSSSSSSP